MSEEHVDYAVPNARASRWLDIRFDDGKHTGVRILAGTTVIEVQRQRRIKVVDIAEVGGVQNPISQSADPGAILSDSVTVSAVPEGKQRQDEK